MRNALSGTIVVLGLSTAASAAVMVSASATPPTGAVISQTVGGGAMDNQQNYSNNKGAPGQTFTATAATPSLASFTFKGSGNSTGGNFVDWTIQVGQVNASTSAIEEIVKTTAHLSSQPGNSDYITFTLEPALPLVAGRVYAVTVYTSGWIGLDHSSTSSYSGGAAFNNNAAATQWLSANPFDGYVYSHPYDYVFYVGTSVPEPTSLSLLGLTCLALGKRRPQHQ